MSTLIFLSIITGSVLYIALPFFKKKTSNDKVDPGNNRLIDLYETRDSLLSTLKDLELDREMGKISDEDFDEISAHYRREAINVLRDIDKLEGDGGVKEPEENMETVFSQQEEGEVALCSACGANVDIHDRFCSRCGQRLLHLS